MDQIRKFIIILAVMGGVYYFSTKRTETPLVVKEGRKSLPQARDSSSPALSGNPQPLSHFQPKHPPALTRSERPLAQTIKRNEPPPKDALKYVLDEGVAVVQGDVVVGQIIDGDGEESGLVRTPTIRLWPSSVIPYFIQPTVREPERILNALELFSGTVLQFVPYTDQDDVMVFEESAGICKSYVGRIGGKQPLWISPGCGSADIAHEIMHALGFVHEQNRADRDSFIELFPDNIEEEYKDNFSRLPEGMMKVNGLSSFDYESLMMYPVSMFSKNGQPTMQSRLQGREIRPSEGLSARDVERINKVYGGL